MIVPERLVAACLGVPERSAWLGRLPDRVRELCVRWSLSLSAPFEGDDVSCAWVAPGIGRDASSVVLKLGMPHMEAAHELHALRFWNGDATVRLLDADEELNAMLLERCEPGTPLRELAEPEQDIVIAGLLRRLWRRPPPSHPFRPLRFADLLEVDAERARLWMFARAAAGPRDVWDEESVALANALA